MNKFEKQVKNLPWAKPSSDLRRRIFTDATPKRGPMVLRFPKQAACWTALWILTGSVIGYSMGRHQNVDRVADSPPTHEVIVVETDPDTHFFNQTDQIDEVIPGKWVLHIEPEGGNQG